MVVTSTDRHLKMFFRTHLAISALGRELLASRPDMQLEIVDSLGHPTHFAGRPRPSIHLSTVRELARGSKKEIASALVHEVIHAVHRHEDENAFRTRNTTASRRATFPNQEEELTITGAIEGSELRDTLCCENWARRCMGLAERQNYD